MKSAILVSRQRFERWMNILVEGLIDTRMYSYEAG